MTSFSLAHVSGNTSASAVRWKSSSVSRAYSAPLRLEVCRFTTVTSAAIATRWSLHWPSVAVVRVPKSSTSTRYLARGCPEMKKPSTAFSRVRRSCSVQGSTSGRREAGCGMGVSPPNKATWPESRSPWRACASENRSEEHTSELQSRLHLVCRLLLEKKKKSSYYAENAVVKLHISMIHKLQIATIYDS